MIKADFRITYRDNSITVLDNTVYASDDFQYNKLGDFKFSDTITLCIMQKACIVNSDIHLTINKHDKKEFDVVINKDGAYNICCIILPLKSWVESNVKDSNDTIVNAYLENDEVLYSSDGTSIFKTRYNEERTIVTELITVEDFIDETGDININSLFVDIDKYVSIKNLIDCYISLCRKLLDCGVMTCCGKDAPNTNETEFKRDMVLMTINVIEILKDRFLEDRNNTHLNEINSILERISGCNGFCAESNRRPGITNCRCGR